MFCHGHHLPEHPRVHVEAWWPRWLDYLMAGKTQKAVVTKMIKGSVRKGWGSWKRDRCRGTLQQPAAICKEAAKKIPGSLLFAVVHGRTMGDNWPKLKCKRFTLDISKTFFPWGESSSESGGTERLCGLYLLKFSGPNRVKPWTSWCGDPALSRWLDFRPPSQPDSSLKFEEVSFPVQAKGCS